VITERPTRKRQEELYEEESPSPPPAPVRRRARREPEDEDIRAEIKRLKTEVRALKKPPCQTSHFSGSLQGRQGQGRQAQPPPC
jgi:hypothetical protein